MTDETVFITFASIPSVEPDHHVEFFDMVDIALAAWTNERPLLPAVGGVVDVGSMRDVVNIPKSIDTMTSDQFDYMRRLAVCVNQVVSECAVEGLRALVVGGTS